MATDPSRRAPRDRDLRRVYVAFGSAMGLFQPYFALLLAHRGFSAQSIGLIIGGYCLAVAVAAPIWSSVADRRHGSAATLRRMLAGAALAAVVLSQSGRGFGATLLAVCLLGAMLGPTTSVLDAMALGHLGAARSETYGTYRLFGSLGWAVTVLTFGLILDQTGLDIVLPALSIGLLVYLVSTSMFGGRGVITAAVRGGSRFGSAVDAIRGNPPFVMFLGGTLLVGIGTLAAWTFVPLRISAAGGSPFLAGCGVGVAALFEVPTMLRSERINLRIGARGCYAAGIAVYVTQMVVWMFVRDPVLVTLVMIVRGVGLGLVCVATVRIAHAMTPAHAKNAGQLLVSMVSLGLAPMIGASAGGFIYEHLGPSVLFGMAAVVTVAGTSLIWRSLQPERAGRASTAATLAS